MILTIDRVNDLLDDMADSFPAALFDGLNGGINLLEEAKPDPEFPEGKMYILGEYCDDLLGQYKNMEGLRQSEAAGALFVSPPLPNAIRRPACICGSAVAPGAHIGKHRPAGWSLNSALWSTPHLAVFPHLVLFLCAAAAADGTALCQKRRGLRCGRGCFPDLIPPPLRTAPPPLSRCSTR